MASLLDLMPQEERDKAIERGKKRLERNKSRKSLDVSPELYIVADFGYFYGWEGVLAIKRGYIEKTDAKGNVVKEPFTLDEVMALTEATNKVWYSKQITQAHGTFAATTAPLYKNPAEAFNRTVQPLVDRAELE